MTDPVKTMSAPAHLGVPLPAPDPEPGCEACARLADRRTAARGTGDWMTVSDCNVQIRRCTH